MQSLLDYMPALDTRPLIEREDDALRLLRERFRRAVDAETDYRSEAVRALEFRNGQQWEEAEKARRMAGGRPCLTINTTSQYERQILNEQRQNRPSIKVRPVGSGADVETAKIYQGLLRHIEQRSHADQAYDTAEEAAVRQGRGYFRILLQYVDPRSFEQELIIRRIRNPFMVYMDPSCQLPTYADAQWGIVFEMQPRVEHMEQYGLGHESMSAWQAEGDSWVSRDEIRVAEYFFKDQTPYTLAKLADNSTLLLEEVLLRPSDLLDEAQAETLHTFIMGMLHSERGMAPLGTIRRKAQDAWTALGPLGQEFTGWFVPNLLELTQNLVALRQTQLDTIWHCKTNGHVILEEGIWPGKYIPIIPVLGNELDINNTVHLSGYLKDAMDPMRMKNYWVTMQAEHVALQPPAPWLVAEGQLEGFAEKWNVANRVPQSYLTYRAVDVRGNAVPPPIRNVFEPPIQGITLAMGGSERDTEASIGIYRASLGARSNETSGKAILARDEQADTGTYHYGDNLRRAIEFCGEQLIDLVPKIPSYTQAEVLRIIGDDGSPQMVRTQQGGVSSHSMPPGDQSGLSGLYDLTAGRYDLVVDVGPSYATKRQEALESLVEVGKISPKVAELGADLIVGNIDAQGMEELSQRIKKTLPPGIVEEAGQGDPKEQVTQLKAGMQQLTQQMEAMNAFAQQCEQQVQQLTVENQALKQQYDLKASEIALKRQEYLLDAEIRRGELALAQEELDMKERLEAVKIRNQREMAHAAAEQESQREKETADTSA